MQLEINGNTYGLIWGTRAFMITEAKLGIGLQDIILGIDDQSIMLNLAYSAMQNWIEDKDESATLPFTFTKFCNWLDIQPEQVGKDIVNSFMESSFQGKTMNERYEAIRAILDAGNTEVDNATKTVKKKKLQPVK